MKMTFILITSLQLMPKLALARLPTTEACNNASILEIRSYAANIQARMQFIDVSSQIEILNNSLKKCNLSPKIFGGNGSTLDNWKKIGLRHELNNYESRIEHFSQYRNVDEEIKRYNQLSDALGISSTETRLFSYRYSTEGKKSQENEKRNCQEIPQIKSEALGPVRQQDSMGWCYAFTAADLLSYKLGKRISAADIATQYVPNFIKSFMKKNFGLTEHDFQGGGWARAALSNLNLKTDGACLESKFASEEDNGYSAIYSILEKIEQIRSQGKTSIDLRQCVAPLKAMFPQLKEKEILDILQNGAEAQLFSLLDNKACGPRIKIDHLSFQSIISSFNSDKNVLKKIDEQLTKRNPVSIMYNGNILSEKYPLTESFHESLLIGRKFNEQSGECEYLLRNSYGRDCGNHHYTFKCTEGNLWIPKSVMMQGKGVKYATYIE